jgi:hypothetical protein
MWTSLDFQTGHLGVHRNVLYATFLNTASVSLRSGNFAVLFRKPNKSWEPSFARPLRRVDAGERALNSGQIKRAKARVVECSEGEDSTRALAGLLAQRTDILVANSHAAIYDDLLFRKTNKAVGVTLESESSRSDAGGEWRRKTLKRFCGDRTTARVLEASQQCRPVPSFLIFACYARWFKFRCRESDLHVEPGSHA